MAFHFHFFAKNICAQALVNSYIDNRSLSNIYQRLNQKSNLSLAKKLDLISSFFLDKPYLLGL